MPHDPNKWCRRIFASVDVAGSTAFKQRSPEDSGRWANIFKLFFDEFPTTLRACFENVDAIADGRPAHPMAVWKFVGDEILFATEIDRHEELAFHAVAFKNAINEYTLQLKKKSELAALSLKGTMWGAGFPVTNAEVATKVGGGDNGLQDYLGPCVDQGFRLCSLADVRRIPVSVDVAYMLATTNFAGQSPLKMQCEEAKPHRGMSLPYPHIWLDRLDGMVSEEDKLLQHRSLHDPSDFKPYLEELYQQRRPGLFKPFLIKDPSQLFNQVPVDIEETRKKLLSATAERTYDTDAEPDAGCNKASPPDPKLPEQGT